MVDVWVVPGASRSVIAGMHGADLKVRVAAPPRRGQANRAVADVLSDAVGARAELVSGGGRRRKRYLLRGVTPAEAARRLGEQGGAARR